MSEAKSTIYCSMDLHPELECGDDCSACKHRRYTCPHCGTVMRYDCDLNIETGSLDIYIICYSCGHTETK